MITSNKNIISLIAAFFGFLLVYYITSLHGVGMSPDSVEYLAVARNLQKLKYWYSFDDQPMIIFPVLYPSFLGLIQAVCKLDVLVTAAYVNAILFGCIVFLSGVFSEKLMPKNPWVKIGVLISVVLSSCLLEIYSMLWSETLFIVLFLLFINFLYKYLNKPTVKLLIITCMIISLICITRIIGVVCIGIAIYTIILNPQFSFKKKLVHGFTVITLGSVTLILNLWRNAVVGNSLTGIRQKSITGFYENLRLTNAVIDHWLQISFYLNANTIIGTLILLACIALMLYKFLRKEPINSLIVVLAVSFTGYCVLILLTSTISRYDPINNRILSPAFIPLLLICIVAAYSLLKKINHNLLKNLMIIFFLGCFLLFNFRQFVSAQILVNNAKSKGIAGYVADDWKRSEILHYLKDNMQGRLKDCTIYSNAPAAVYFHSGLSCYIIPEKMHEGEDEEYYQSPKHYLILFSKESFKDELLSLDSISRHKHIDTVAILRDGTVYQIR